MLRKDDAIHQMSQLGYVHRFERSQVARMMARILGHDDLADDDVLHFRRSMATMAASFHRIVQPFSVQLGVLAKHLSVLEKTRFIHNAEHVSTRVFRNLYACLFLQSRVRVSHAVLFLSLLCAHLDSSDFMLAHRGDQLTEERFVNEIHLSDANEIA